MLRDLVTKLDRTGTWPCDELNPMWRYRNAGYPSDALPPHLARPDVKQYINTRFSKLAERRSLDTVIEKTCANSLRLPFVNAIVGEARYLFIVRNGLDAVASAVKRWHARPELPYLWRKARFVPLADIPHYGMRFAANQMRRMFADTRPVNSWGPVTDDMAQLQETESTVAMCAHQWRACVELASEYLGALPADRVLRIRYEDFVGDPVKRFGEIAAFVGKAVSTRLADYVDQHVVRSRTGIGYTEMNADELTVVRHIIGPSMDIHGYA